MAWKTVVSDVVNEDSGEEFEATNVLPDFGREHELHPGCWCQPIRDYDTIYHNIFH